MTGKPDRKALDDFITSLDRIKSEAESRDSRLLRPLHVHPDYEHWFTHAAGTGLHRTGIHMRAEPSRERVDVVARAHYGVDPKAYEQWANLRPSMQATDAAGEIQIYGLILPHEEVTFLRECWGDETAMSGKMFREAMEAIDGDVTLRINSDGGDVFEASTMLQAIRERQGEGHAVNAVVDGIAASAASLLACASQDITIAELGFIMVHEASGGMYGRADDLETGAKLLRDMNAAAAKMYADRTDMERDEILAMMDAETFLGAEEAVDKGFANRVAEAPAVDTEAKRKKAAMERRNARLAAIMQANSVH